MATGTGEDAPKMVLTSREDVPLDTRSGERNSVVPDREEIAAETSLELGMVYEAAGRFKEAETAYAKAYLSGNRLVRKRAREALERVLRKQEALVTRSFEWLGTLLEPLIRTALQAFFVILFVVLLSQVLSQIGNKRGKNTLGIAVSDSTEQKLGSSLGDLIKLTHERIDYYFRHADGIIAGNLPARARGEEGPRLPAIVSIRDVELIQLVELTAEGLTGKIGGYLVQLLKHPEFTFHATLKNVGQDTNFIAYLERWGKIWWAWDVVSSVPEYLETERDLVFEILMHLKEYGDNENAR